MAASNRGMAMFKTAAITEATEKSLAVTRFET